MGIKLGSDGLFRYLRSEHILKNQRKYTKSTHSKHWLRKYYNLYALDKTKSPE